MFSKNITLLLCVVVFIADEASMDNTSVVNVNPNLEKLSTKEWKKIFIKYDIDHDGSISATELQTLIFEVFNGFLTIRQAETYTLLINLQRSTEIKLEQLKRMKPMIFVLSQRGGVEENQNYKISSEDFVNMIANTFSEIFIDKNEVLVVLKLVGFNEQSEIEWAEYSKIVKMLEASDRMEQLHKEFLSLNDLTKEQYQNGDGVVDFHIFLSKRCNLFRYTSSSYITDLFNGFKKTFVRCCENF